MLKLKLPAPTNIHCATCLVSTEHVDLACSTCGRKLEVVS